MAKLRTAQSTPELGKVANRIKSRSHLPECCMQNHMQSVVNSPTTQMNPVVVRRLEMPFHWRAFG